MSKRGTGVDSRGCVLEKTSSEEWNEIQVKAVGLRQACECGQDTTKLDLKYISLGSPGLVTVCCFIQQTQSLQ